MTKTSAVVIGIRSLMSDWNIRIMPRTHTDSGTAKALTQRLGVAGTKHMLNKCLWVQERVQSQELEVMTVGTEQNPSDVLTKATCATTLDRHCASCGLLFI